MAHLLKSSLHVNMTKASSLGRYPQGGPITSNNNNNNNNVVDSVAPNLLQFRIQSQLHDDDGDDGDDDSKRRRGTMRPRLTDAGNTQPLMPVRKMDSIQTVEDVRDLCEYEFEQTMLVDRSNELPQFKFEGTQRRKKKF